MKMENSNINHDLIEIKKSDLNNRNPIFFMTNCDFFQSCFRILVFNSIVHSFEMSTGFGVM